MRALGMLCFLPGPPGGWAWAWSLPPAPFRVPSEGCRVLRRLKGQGQCHLPARLPTGLCQKLRAARVAVWGFCGVGPQSPGWWPVTRVPVRLFRQSPQKSI